MKYFFPILMSASIVLNIVLFTVIFTSNNTSNKDISLSDLRNQDDIKSNGIYESAGLIQVYSPINQLDDQNFIYDPCKLWGPVTYGSTGTIPKYHSIGEMPENMQQRYYELYSARTRNFIPLDSIIENFSFEKLTIPEAVAKLSNEHNVLCGIEVINYKQSINDSKPYEGERYSLSLTKVTPSAILNKLVSLDPNFVWFEEEDGIINVVMRNAFENPDYSFNIVISHYEIKDVPYPFVFMGYRSLNSLSEVKGLMPFGGDLRWEAQYAPKISIKASNKTVRQIINAVGKNIGMSWSAVLCSGPNNMTWISFQMVPKLPPPKPCGN